MPLWTVYHPVGAYTAADKEAMATALTTLYPILPKFYVGAVFQEVANDSFFIGGKPVDNFVRIAVDHIARQFPNDEIRQRWLDMTTTALAPFIADRGYEWELHVDETPFNIWLIQGMRPPLPDSGMEKQWISENRPVPFDAAS